ncbi:Uncharacterised protein [Halioglobus japonicus]|nr:Uncharacterised protein [Halioglobus japonicus]
MSIIKSVSARKLLLSTFLLGISINHWAIAESLGQDKIDKVEAESGPYSRFIMSPEDQRKYTTAIQQRQMDGYLSKENEEPRYEYIVDKMASFKEAAKLKNGEMNSHDLGYIDITGQDYVDIDSLPFRPAIVPGHFLEKENRSYLLLGGNRLKQIYSDSVFGTLIVDEFENTRMKLDQPNVMVNGQSATFTYIKYKGEQWASVLYAPAGNRLFILEAGEKLSDDKRDSLIRLAESLIEASFSMN